MKEVDLLITGASGYIGSKLFEVAKKNNLNVMGVGKTKLYTDNYRVFDLSKTTTPLKLNEEFKICTIIHTAALVPTSGGEYDLPEYIYQNQLITENLLKINSSNLIALSSISVYGSKCYGEVSEFNDLNPETKYALSKIEMEKKILSEYLGNKKILRIPGVFGEPKRNGWVYKIIQDLNKGESLTNVSDAAWSCMYLEDLSELLISNFKKLLKLDCDIHNIAYQEFNSPQITLNKLLELLKAEDQKYSKINKKTLYKTQDPNLTKILQKYSLNKALKRYSNCFEGS